MYRYIDGTSYKKIARELNVSRATVSDYCDQIRDIISEHMVTTNVKIGGYRGNSTTKIVEIDESLFFKRKYNRGRLVEGQWYVGGVERGTNRSFIVPVFDRSAETMARIIMNNVLPGSTIITDQWRAYERALRNMPDFQHRSVNHCINFVDPFDSTIHTQSIEGLWSLAKKYLDDKRGISQDQHEEFLIQFVWEHGILEEKRFNTLLILLKKIYLIFHFFKIFQKRHLISKTTSNFKNDI
ncbi:hypothetical protein DMUE_3065 [Dictyocoela muelleri]|nr:hypothetical protein DMUE_3065 [Dictyocoela muelleri]